MKVENRTIYFVFLLLIGLCVVRPAVGEELPPVPDYSLDKNWISLPKAPDRPVDLFWLYPTVFNGETTIAALDDPAMVEPATATLKSYAGVFAGAANVFAPLYRQSNITVLSMGPEDQERYLAVGSDDALKAFEYYLEHLNQGRPFILAGHSQGSDLMLGLMKQKMSDPELRQRLVAAYIIGWSVTKDDLTESPFLQICDDARRTGCIVTYNSLADGTQEKAPTIGPGAIVVNPLSWTTDGQVAPASENLGAVFFDEDGKSTEVPSFASAQVKDGGLVIVAADPARLDWLPFGPGIYHTYDYSLFYRNLEANAALRCRSFLEK